ncbi:MAG: hypothetical protein HYU75_04550, partial [Betaproteobacteria bacterium]|nr:hypothetical protein [Betaproteobacteria bacterium]
QAVTVKDPGAYGLAYGIEVLLHTPVNALLSSFGDLKDVERLYRSLKFMAGFAVEINETNLFDDIVLPFPSHLERFDFVTGLATTTIPPCGEHDFYWQVRHPVLEPPPGVRHPQDVIIEIAERAGVLKDLYRIMSHTFALKDNYALKGDKRYPIAEIIDREARSWFGDEHGLAWFKENGVIRFPRSVKENYFGPFLEARVPIYLEHFLDRGDELKEVLGKLGLEWDLSDYTPISEWMPCPSYRAIQNGDYDLIAVHFKLPYIYGAFANENPWIDELCEATGAYKILINEAVAKAKGIADGDAVWLESPVCKVRAIAKLTQCIHPEAVGVAGHFGHWAPGMPVARGKGVNFNSLCPSDMEHVDMISTALDHCVEVKVYK